MILKNTVLFLVCILVSLMYMGCAKDVVEPDEIIEKEKKDFSSDYRYKYTGNFHFTFIRSWTSYNPHIPTSVDTTSEFDGSIEIVEQLDSILVIYFRSKYDMSDNRNHLSRSYLGGTFFLPKLDPDEIGVQRRKLYYKYKDYPGAIAGVFSGPDLVLFFDTNSGRVGFQYTVYGVRLQ